MSEASTTPNQSPISATTLPHDDDDHSFGLLAQLKLWFTTEAPSWAASAAVHMVLFLIAVLVLGTITSSVPKSDASKFAAVVNDISPPAEFQRLVLGPPQELPGKLDDESLRIDIEVLPPQNLDSKLDTPEFMASGGSSAASGEMFGPTGGFRVFGTGTALPGNHQPWIGNSPGNDGPGRFSGRDPENRGPRFGPTQPSEQAVSAALRWLSRHQNPDGSWSIQHNTAKCTDPSCKYTGGDKADVGATALALLPFLGAGQTHITRPNAKRGLYQETVARGIRWLIAQQKASGELSSTSARQMYEHGLATIAMCECYGMSNDESLRYPTQAALNFVSSGQNGKGGWRYQHGTPDTDTSVVGWQVMALKSGQMAGLTVNPAVLDKAKAGLLEAASGEYKGKFGYQPSKPANPPMTAVGLLCLQYLGTPRGDAGLREGIDYLMKAMPADINGAAPRESNIYFWYYATQVMHNVPGADWEKWNRNMRGVLVNSQVRGKSCAEGSWDPAKDNWGSRAGGRIMTTALSALTLEVYYRYLPLYQLDRNAEL